MTSGQKVAFSLLISVLAFCAFTVVAFSGLFDLLEVNFYQPVVQDIKQKKIEEIASAQNEYFKTLMKRFDSFTRNDDVKTYVDTRSSDSVAKRREILRTQLLEATSSLKGIRIVAENGRNLFFSTFDSDLISGKKGISYKNYDSMEEISYSSLAADKNLKIDDPFEKKSLVFKDGEKGLLIFSLPFFNSSDEFAGSIFFYCDSAGFSQYLLNKNLIDISGFAQLVTPVRNKDSKTLENFGGFVFGLPNAGQNSLKNQLLEKWRSSENGDFWKLIPEENPDKEVVDKENSVKSGIESLFAKNDDKLLCAFSRKPEREDFGFITFIYDESELKFPPYMRLLLLATAFVTLYLAVFLILSFKHDDIVIIRDKVRRYENEFFVAYKKMGETKSPAYLSEQKKVLERRILKSLGKKGEKYAAEFKSLFDGYWNEMLLSFGEAPAQLASSASAPIINADELKEIVRSSLEDILENGKIQIKADLANLSQKVEPKKTVEAVPMAETEPAAELDEVEPLDETEHLETVEPIEPVDEVESLEEAEPLEAVEPVESVDEVESLEEAEPVEPAEEVESLEEAAPADDVEEIEEVVEAEDGIEEIEEAEALEAAESLEEVEKAESADELDEVEPLEPVEPLDEAEPLEVVEPVEPVGEVDSLKEAEPVEPAEEVESLEEAAPADDVEEIKEVAEAEEIEEAEALEDAESVEEVEEAEPADEPDEVEPLEKAEPLEALEPVEPIEEVESLEEAAPADDVEEIEEVAEAEDGIEEIEEAEALEDAESVEEVEEAESADEPDEVEPLEPVEPLDEAEPLEEAESLEPAEEVESLEEAAPADDVEEIEEVAEAEELADEIEELEEVSEAEEDTAEIDFDAVNEVESLNALDDEELDLLPEVDDSEYKKIDMERTLAALPERAPRWNDMDEVELDSDGLSRKLSFSEMHDIQKLKDAAKIVEEKDAELEELEVFDPELQNAMQKVVDTDLYAPHILDSNVSPDDDIYRDEALLEKIEFGVPNPETSDEETDDSVAEKFVAVQLDFTSLDAEDSDDKMYVLQPPADATENEHYFENPELVGSEETGELEALEEPEETMPFMFTKFAASQNSEPMELSSDVDDAIVQNNDGTFRVTEMPRVNANIHLDMEFKKLVDSILR